MPARKHNLKNPQLTFHTVATRRNIALLRIGARFPQELFGRVLHFTHASDGKRTLGQLALTCRYWATKCQPAIFEKIKLQSSKDLDELLVLMESPLSRIASYIKRLQLFQEEPPKPPWIHLVALRLVPKLSLYTDTPMMLFLSKVAVSRGFRSIHDALPRVYPSFSSHISYLSLWNARFNSLADLFHLVDEIHPLRELNLRCLTWPTTAPDTQPVVLPQRRIPPHLFYVDVSKCTDNLVGIQILTGRRRKVRGETSTLDFDLDHEQQHTIYKMMLAMMEGHPDAHCKLRLDKVNSAYNKITVDRTLYYGALLTFILSSDSKHNIEIVAIDIPVYSDNRLEIFSTVCEHLPPLQKLIIGFKSKEDISHYVHKVMNPKLGDLRSVDKVEYAVLGGEYGKYQWLRKLPDSEDWKETGLGRADLWRF